MNGTAICQVAFCLGGKSRLWDWYRDGFQLLPSGATLFLGPPATKVNGLPFPIFPGRWLIDSQGLLQLEFFRFIRPKPKPRRPDERLCDIGYRMLGIHTVEFDSTLERLDALDGRRAGPVIGEPGERRVCYEDPEGNLVELLEDDPLAGHGPDKERPDVPATVRFVTVSVPDLEASLRDWTEALGLVEAPGGPLHHAEHEALWGLDGAERKSVVLQGGGVLIELVEYVEPRGRPLPDGYRICDQGFMNIALGLPNRREYDRLFANMVAKGCRPTSPKPLEFGIFRVMYFDTPSGQNVELLYPRRWAFGLTGFRPSGVYAAADVWVDVPPETAWAYMSDHEALGTWTPFRAQLTPEGTPDKSGLGDVRHVRGLGLSLDERIVEWDPPHRYTYRVEGSLVVRRHRGDLVVRADQGGSRIRWAIRLKPFFGLGWLVKRLLRRMVERSLRRLKARLEGS